MNDAFTIIVTMHAEARQAALQGRQLTRAQRLADGIDMPDKPVVRYRPTGTWEKRHRGLAPAVWSEVLP